MNKDEWMRALLRDYERRLLRYAMRFVPEAVARELVQETFLRAWQQESNALAGHEVEWLFRVCRNLTIDHQRKEGRTRFGLGEEGPELVADVEQTDGLRQMERLQTESQVLETLQRLSAKHQEVIRMKFQEGMSYKEISRVTGHSVSYVGVLIHEGVTILREAMSDGQEPRSGGSHGG